MFYILEMANNHQGSVDHARAIIDDFYRLKEKHNLNVGLKVQFRNLDTFIHEDFKNSDLKYVRRFNETRLEENEFSKILRYARKRGMKTVATPFDNESLHLFDKLDVDILKIASCSSDDWPLLREIATMQRKIIMSTAGAEIEDLQKAYNLFKSHNRDFAFMHCVGDYPTPRDSANLSRILLLKDLFPDIEIGFSTHESPDEKSLAPFACALGCTIVEKHIGKETKDISLNAYSCNVDQYEKMVEDIHDFKLAFSGVSNTQKESLSNLKRGAYIKRDMKKGDYISDSDVFYAMPCQKSQLDASKVDLIIGSQLKEDLVKNQAIYSSSILEMDSDNIKSIIRDISDILDRSGISISEKDSCEISCHYGIENFRKYGAFIVDKVNREYCKKIIAMLPMQSHPEHYHIRKEETFELISGDCLLNLNGKEIQMKRGDPILIPRGVKHSFKTERGCVIEEISTTHHVGDSIYTDPTILRKKTADRKVKCKIR